MIDPRVGRRSRGARVWIVLAALVALTSPADAGAAPAPPAASAAQDCKVACGLVLGVSSFTIATGSVVTWGRISGGIPLPSQGTTIWTIGFGASLAVGSGLYGDRRERAVFASGIGVVAGALAGFTVESLGGSGDKSAKIAAAIIGAAAGAVAGGVYGALSHEQHMDAPGLVATRHAPLLALRFSF